MVRRNPGTIAKRADRFNKAPRRHKAASHSNSSHYMMMNPRTDTLLAKVQYCNFKLTVVIPIVGSQQAPLFVAVFHRYDYASVGQPEIHGLNKASLFTSISKIFEEYAVTGFRLDFTPASAGA